MLDRTLEESFRIIENIHRADCLTGAMCALEIAVEAEEAPEYREYLDVTIRAFLEQESRKAQAAHHAYLREVGIRPQ